MTLGRSRRYARSVVAVTAAVAVALSTAVAASASPARARDAGAPVYVRSAAHAIPVSRPMGALPGLGAPIIIHDNAHPSGLVGYAICLYNSQDNCLSDTSAPIAKKGSTEVVIIATTVGTLARDIIVWAVKKFGPKVWKWVKKYFINVGKHQLVQGGPGTGDCAGAWGNNTDVLLGNCMSRHGIYWQLQTPLDRFWNTYSKGDLIAANTDPGTAIIVHSLEDWSRWVFIKVCDVTC